ncbi:MAG: halocarboxylic acid dehydrogenase DehI family protein [Bacteroidetes bacterium]|nr:halocarboxylic acid dehydrogenase DehI family protein [Bacteroidota bacterium]
MDEKQALIDRGLQLLTKPTPWQPKATHTSAQTLLEEIELCLRAPQLNNFFLSLAQYPEYLQQLWEHYSPAFSRNSFEQQADHIREKALLETVPEIPEVSWDVATEKDRLRAFIDTHFYTLPKLLLIATLFHEATFRGLPDRSGRRQSDETADPTLPKGLASGTIRLAPLDVQKVPDQVQELFASIMKLHQMPLVSFLYDGLAHWPNFLKEAWQQMMQLVGSSDYESLKDFLIYQAQMSLRRLSLPPLAISTLSTAQKEEIEALLTAFRYKILPELLIDTAMIKAMLDGTAEAYTSPFSLTAPDEPDEDNEEA